MTTSTGKYKVNTANLYNRHQGEYTNSSSNNYSTPRRPHRTSNATTHRNKVQQSRTEDVTDGEDEKRLLSLSERIKKLSTSKVLKDNSVLTHNNNEPFTYLRSPQKKSGGLNTGGSSSAFSKNPPKPLRSANVTKIPSNISKAREVIYAQVVVDPEDRKNNPNNFNGKNKRTVHRSYNNNNYTSPYSNKTSFSSSANKNSVTNMKGRNVTTVLLNSSSDDIPSSLNIEERVGFNNDSRYRSSSSPLLASHDDYYPKSPGIVKHMQNGHSTSGGGSRSRYENHYQRHSTDYLHRQSDDDDGYNDYKFGGKNKYSSLAKNRDRSPFEYGGRDTDNSDDFYQPVNYGGGKSSSTNLIDNYGYNPPRTNYRIDEEDEYDVTRNSKFEEHRSKTLDRDQSFRNYGNRTEDFINRSKTLDNRISSLRERSMMLEEQSKRERGEPYDNYNLASHTNKSELDTTFPKKSNAQGKNTLTKTKEKSGGSSNIFSTLLRRNNNKKANLPQSKSTSVLNTSNIANNNKGITITKSESSKKTGQNSNFFTSFLEKKRNKKQQQQLNTDLNKKGQAQKGDGQTYQSFSNWPSDPPSLSVIDYSGPKPVSKPYYGGSNIDTEDTEAHGSDIWKKSYGNDMTKVKRRWTMREPPAKTNAVNDMTTSTLGRKPNYTSTIGINSNSIDRRKTRNYSAEREGNYDSSNKKGYYDESDSFLKVPGTTPSGGKYNTIDTRYSSPEKTRYSSPQKYDEYEGYGNNVNTSSLTRRGRIKSSDKFSKGYGGGGFIGTPNSSGSESNNNRMVNGSLRSVYLHEPAVINEMPMPRTTTGSGDVGGGGASLLSGLSGRRTLSKDEISNYSGPRKEAKQLSRSMSLAHPWGPSKTYREKYSEIDYSRNSNLPPRPPSRSPSGSLGIHNSKIGTIGSKAHSPSKSFSQGRPKPPIPTSSAKGSRKQVSSSVESLLRQDTPDEVLQKKKASSSKLGRSKSMSVSQSQAASRDGKNSRFSTLWFNKKNANK